MWSVRSASFANLHVFEFADSCSDGKCNFCIKMREKIGAHLFSEGVWFLVKTYTVLAPHALFQTSVHFSKLKHAWSIEKMFLKGHGHECQSMNTNRNSTNKNSNEHQSTPIKKSINRPYCSMELRLYQEVKLKYITLIPVVQNNYNLKWSLIVLVTIQSKSQVLWQLWRFLRFDAWTNSCSEKSFGAFTILTHMWFENTSSHGRQIRLTIVLSDRDACTSLYVPIFVMLFTIS